MSEINLFSTTKEICVLADKELIDFCISKDEKVKITLLLQSLKIFYY